MECALGHCPAAERIVALWAQATHNATVEDVFVEGMMLSFAQWYGTAFVLWHVMGKYLFCAVLAILLLMILKRKLLEIWDLFWLPEVECASAINKVGPGLVPWVYAHARGPCMHCRGVGELQTKAEKYTRFRFPAMRCKWCILKFKPRYAEFSCCNGTFVRAATLVNKHATFPDKTVLPEIRLTHGGNLENEVEECVENSKFACIIAMLAAYHEFTDWVTIVRNPIVSVEGETANRRGSFVRTMSCSCVWFLRAMRCVCLCSWKFLYTCVILPVMICLYHVARGLWHALLWLFYRLISFCKPTRAHERDGDDDPDIEEGRPTRPLRELEMRLLSQPVEEVESTTSTPDEDSADGAPEAPPPSEAPSVEATQASSSSGLLEGGAPQDEPITWVSSLHEHVCECGRKYQHRHRHKAGVEHSHLTRFCKSPHPGRCEFTEPACPNRRCKHGYIRVPPLHRPGPSPENRAYRAYLRAERDADNTLRMTGIGIMIARKWLLQRAAELGDPGTDEDSESQYGDIPPLLPGDTQPLVCPPPGLDGVESPCLNPVEVRMLTQGQCVDGPCADHSAAASSAAEWQEQRTIRFPTEAEDDHSLCSIVDDSRSASGLLITRLTRREARLLGGDSSDEDDEPTWINRVSAEQSSSSWHDLRSQELGKSAALPDVELAEPVSEGDFSVENADGRVYTKANMPAITFMHMGNLDVVDKAKKTGIALPMALDGVPRAPDEPQVGRVFGELRETTPHPANERKLIRKGITLERVEAVRASYGEDSAGAYMKENKIRPQAESLLTGIAAQTVGHIAAPTAANHIGATLARNFPDKALPGPASPSSPSRPGRHIPGQRDNRLGNVKEEYIPHIRQAVKLLCEHALLNAGLHGYAPDNDFFTLPEGYEPTTADLTTSARHDWIDPPLDQMAPKKWPTEAKFQEVAKACCAPFYDKKTDKMDKRYKGWYGSRKAHHSKLDEILLKIRARLIQHRGRYGTVIGKAAIDKLNGIILGLPVILLSTIKHAGPDATRQRLANKLAGFLDGYFMSMDFGTFEASIRHKESEEGGWVGMLDIVERELVTVLLEGNEGSHIEKAAISQMLSDRLKSQGDFWEFYAKEFGRESGDPGTSILNLITNLVIWMVIMALEDGHLDVTQQSVENVFRVDKDGNEVHVGLDIMPNWNGINEWLLGLKPSTIGYDWNGEGDDGGWAMGKKWVKRRVKHMNTNIKRNHDGVYMKRANGQPQIPNAVDADAALAIGVRIKYWSSALGVILEAQDETGEAKKERRVMPTVERVEFVSKLIVPFDTCGNFGPQLCEPKVLHEISLPYEQNKRTLRVALVPKLRRTLASHVTSFHIPQVLGSEQFEINRLYAKYVSLAYNASDAPLLFAPFIRMSELACAAGGKLTEANLGYTTRNMVTDFGIDVESEPEGGSSILIGKLKGVHWTKVSRPGHLQAVQAAIHYETRANKGGLTPKQQERFCEAFSSCDSMRKWCDIMNVLCSRLGAM